jgi:preprotein translocase subunit SecE
VTKAKAAKREKPRGRAIVHYLRETRAELRKVHWPTRQEAWDLTKIVLAVTVSMALFLGLMDYLFALELRGIVAGQAVALGVVGVVVVACVVVLFVALRRRVAR